VLSEPEITAFLTRVRPGSHLDVPAVPAPAGDAGMAWPRAAQQAAHPRPARRGLHTEFPQDDRGEPLFPVEQAILTGLDNTVFRERTTRESGPPAS
jgi:hypothetical protein